jgi:hypothetical protein
MVSDKLEAGLALQALALTAGLGLTTVSASTKTLAHYPRKGARKQAPARESGEDR